MSDSLTIDVSGLKNGSCGQIYRSGNTNDGRYLYTILNSDGTKSSKISVPAEETDRFEKAFEDVKNTAPKLQEYANEHAKADEIKRRKFISTAIVVFGGIVGAAVPMVLTQKSKSTAKQIVSTVAGIIAGLSCGFAFSLYFTTPPGAYKIAKAARTFSEIDIRQEKNQ